ncbi:MAG: ComEC/Rec2 family competence protein [Candidatus Binatia bacterium]
MAEIRFLDDDIIRLYAHGKPRTKANLVATLFWGDQIRVVTEEGEEVAEMWRWIWDAQNRRYRWVRYLCALPARIKFRPGPVLKVRFVDVGQGDAAIIETPKGKVLLVDGGEEEHLRNYIKKAYSHILRTRPLHCNAVVVTHGDADHYEGLTKLIEGRGRNNRALITADYVYHNGLVKDSYDRDVEAFGKTVKSDGKTYAVDLVDNLLTADESRMNTPFQRWKKALLQLKRDSSGLKCRRLEFGGDGAFGFLAEEGIQIQILGPITETIQGKPALPFLRRPGGGLSASHTVNGHSVILKLTLGNVRFLFGADLNQESEERLLDAAKARTLSLTAEILKVPHHGSADFSPRMLEAVKPVVSVISSGDENEAKEYIHPRAGLVGALGKFSRGTVDKPLIYVTEMVAFFARLGDINATGLKGRKKDEVVAVHNAYQKTQFGIVHVRTDGQRVSVVTHSGKDDQKESYAFTVDERGDISFSEETTIV